MRVRTLLSVVASTLFIAASGEVAFAWQYHGIQCKPAAPYVHSVGYSQFGIHNASDQPVLVHCAAPKLPSASSTAMNVTGYDRSPTDDLNCSVYLLDAAGN